MIDIIMPVYNNTKGLFRALASIASQTRPDKCIVTVVDDCSTEDMKSVCLLFKGQIKIQYIRNEENLKFPGLVRQVGLDHTNAPYIMFLDNDDMLAPQAVELAQKGMMESNADVIIGYFYAENQNGQFKVMDESQTTWLHGNVYKREYLVKNNIRFPHGFNEDGGFNTQCYLLTDKISVINQPMYYWMFNHESLTRENSEGMFSIVHCDDIVSTLTAAYVNVFNIQLGTEKNIKNLGKHLALFHMLINNIVVLQDEEEREKYLNMMWAALLQFTDTLKIQNMLENSILLDWIKKGFIEGYLQYGKKSKQISANEFFSKYLGLHDFELTIDDFIQVNG